MFAHFGAVEADFQSHYGLDLREVLWGKRPTGVRRVLSLVNGLPMQGAVYRSAATNGQYWTTTEELLATLIELTDLTNRLFYGANSGKGSKVWEPLQINRPMTKSSEAPPPPPTERATAAELRAFVVSTGGEVVTDA